MHCTEFRQHWSEWHAGADECDAAAMAAHCRECEACARYDRQMRRLLMELSDLPLPGGERTPAPARDRLRWAALAATLVIGVALGMMLSARFAGDAGISAKAVTVEGPGVQRVAVAFESPERLQDVEFVVELPRGVELVGFPGQRRVRWDGQLAAGRSRLQLPLRITHDAELGTLVTRVVHDTGERRLEVPLRFREGEGDDDTA